MKAGRPTNFNGAKQGHVGTVNPMTQPVVECGNPDCTGTYFAPCARIHKVSGLLTKSGKTEYAAEPASYCITCGTPLKQKP